MRRLLVTALVFCCVSAQADELKDAYDQSNLLEEKGKYQEALPFAQEAVRLAETKFGEDDKTTTIFLNNLGSLYRDLGEYAKAEPLYMRALEIDEKAYGPEHPKVAMRLNNLGLLYDHLGDYAKAEPLYMRALEIDEMAYGPEHPRVAASLNNLGSLYDDLGDYAKAEPLLKRALAIDEKVLGPEHPQLAMSLNNLGLLYDELGDYAKAESLNTRALEILEKALGPEHPDTKTVRETLDCFAPRHGLRTWQSAKGTYSSEAHFVSLKDGVIQLQYPDGETKDIPVEKLLQEDQEYAANAQQLLDEDAAEPAEKNPFQSKIFANEYQSEFLDADVLSSINALYKERDSTFTLGYSQIKNFYENTLPLRKQQENQVKQAQRLVEQKKFSNKANLFGGDPSVQAAANALANAVSILKRDDFLYQQQRKRVLQIEADIHKTYMELRQCLPKDGRDPLVVRITDAFEEGSLLDNAPIEAHVLTAISASYANDVDRARAHLHAIQDEKLFDEWPPWYPLTIDFCVACIMIGEEDLCTEQLRFISGSLKESKDPHVFWGVALCKAYTQKPSATYFRKAVAFCTEDSSEYLRTQIFTDSCAHLGLGKSSLPKSILEYAGTEKFLESGRWQAILAKKSNVEDYNEALKRVPPPYRKQIELVFGSDEAQAVPEAKSTGADSRITLD